MDRDIIVRPYQDADKPAIEAMHKGMGFDYQAPNWGGLDVSAVVEVNGVPEMAGFLRKTAEAYLLLNPEAGSRKQKLQNLLILHRELIKPAQRAGFEDIHSWPPPEIEDHFGPLLMHLAWSKALWPCYSRKVR